ncbi:MAG: hypothetical protein ABIP38_02675, partial [Steroidobacteraceae bacterium]
MSRKSASMALLLCMVGAAAAAPPDLTGIWSMQADGKAAGVLNGVGDFQKTAPFTPTARRRVAEYNALVDPTGETPGTYCVQHGMPL